MENKPGIVRNNPLTRLMDEVKGMNQDRGALAGRVTGTPIIGGSSPSVRSANMAPLTPEELSERNQLALAAGIVTEEEIDPDEKTYHKAYCAISETGRCTCGEPLGTYPVPNPPRGLTATEIINSKPRIPNFKNVQGMDFHRNVAFVDGFEIEIPEEDVKRFKLFIVNLAVDFVTQQLAKAIAEINPLEVLETPDGEEPEVRETT